MEQAVKRLLVLLTTLVLVGVFSAFRMLETQTVKGLERIGIPAETVNSSIWNSISGGYLSMPFPDKLRTIASGNRAAIVREIAAYAQRYARTEEFKKRYLEYRESKKPDLPEKPMPMEEQRKAQKAELQKGLKEAEENMKKAPSNQKEIFKGVIDMFKDQLKEIDKPNNPMYSKDMDAMMMQGYDAQMEEYKTRVAEWEKEWPLLPAPMIRKWLTEFLEVSKDVDYNAALKPGEFGKKIFVNPEYENKSANWKMCYRAGKETVEAGRAAAQQWLKELK